MACDIHLHVEKRTSVGWQQIGDELDWYDYRNYHLFARLAGVRSDGAITPIAEPRGLPNDLSGPAAADVAVWDGEGHSWSWFTARELAAHPWEDSEWNAAVSLMCAIAGDDLDSVRVVFWFDN